MEQFPYFGGFKTLYNDNNLYKVRKVGEVGCSLLPAAPLIVPKNFCKVNDNYH